MAIGWGIFLLVSGFLTGHLIPRIPLIIIPRQRTFNQVFPVHPRPIPVDASLVSRVLQMRAMRRWGLVFTIVPLLFGWMMLKWSVAMFGMGLFLAGGWTLLSWLLPLAPGVANSPWTLEVAQQLQIIRNDCDGESTCCESPQPEWELTAVRCSACRTTLLNLARPDLGRPRCDGKFKGFLRIWISDGGAILVGEEE
jgi:hypothetical protein